MDEKQHAVDLLIEGKIYRISTPDPDYIARVGTYINSKVEECKGLKTYRSLDGDYRKLLVNLNIADDVFRREKELEELRKKLEDQEKELYGLRHDIVSTKMKLEAGEKEKKQLQEQIAALKQQVQTLSSAKDYSRERGH